MASRLVTPVQAARIVEKVARALSAVHAAGMVHRDIKPANVMIDEAGEPILMDFGLARLAGHDSGDEPTFRHRAKAHDGKGKLDSSDLLPDHSCLTLSGDVLGTLPYMSPEQTYGEAVGAASDIYSLGALFYQLLSGRRPFQGSANEVLEGIRHSPPPRPGELRPGLDAGLEAICLKAMSRNPSERYRSAEEMADAICAAGAGK